MPIQKLHTVDVLAGTSNTKSSLYTLMLHHLSNLLVINRFTPKGRPAHVNEQLERIVRNHCRTELPIFDLEHIPFAIDFNVRDQFTLTNRDYRISLRPLANGDYEISLLEIDPLKAKRISMETIVAYQPQLVIDYLKELANREDKAPTVEIYKPEKVVDSDETHNFGDIFRVRFNSKDGLNVFQLSAYSFGSPIDRILLPSHCLDSHIGNNVLAIYEKQDL